MNKTKKTNWKSIADKASLCIMIKKIILFFQNLYVENRRFMRILLYNNTYFMPPTWIFHNIFLQFKITQLVHLRIVFLLEEITLFNLLLLWYKWVYFPLHNCPRPKYSLCQFHTFVQITWYLYIYILFFSRVDVVP